MKLWVPTGAKKSYSDTVAQFEKKSGYKVDMVEMEDPNAQENLTKDASTAADVFSLPHDQLGKLVDAGAIKLTPSHTVSKLKLHTTTNLNLMKKM